MSESLYHRSSVHFISSYCSLVISPRAHGCSELRLTPLQLIERLAALISPPRIHRHRYHGVLAPNSPQRAQVTALAREPPPASPPPTPSGSRARPTAGGPGARARARRRPAPGLGIPPDSSAIHPEPVHRLEDPGLPRSPRVWRLTPCHRAPPARCASQSRCPRPSPRTRRLARTRPRPAFRKTRRGTSTSRPSRTTWAATASTHPSRRRTSGGRPPAAALGRVHERQYVTEWPPSPRGCLAERAFARRTSSGSPRGPPRPPEAGRAPTAGGPRDFRAAACTGQCPGPVSGERTAPG